MRQYFAETLQVISFKNDVYFLHGRSREKAPSLKKITPFLQYKLFKRDAINLGFCVFEDVTDYRDWRRGNLKSFVLIGLFGFATQVHKTTPL